MKVYFVSAIVCGKFL